MKHLLKKGLFLVIGFALVAPVIHASSVPTNVDPVELLIPETVTPISVHDAVAGFRDLSKSERKAKIKEVKQVLKEYKKEKRAGAAASTNTLLLVILAILLPPLAVYLHQGEINNKFWISLLLTLLFFLPGVIYSIIVVTGND